jgi:hypothetical protein
LNSALEWIDGCSAFPKIALLYRSTVERELLCKTMRKRSVLRKISEPIL